MDIVPFGTERTFKIEVKEMRKHITERIALLKTSIEKNDIETAQKAAIYLLKNAVLLSERESVEVAELIPKMLEKARQKRKDDEESEKKLRRIAKIE